MLLLLPMTPVLDPLVATAMAVVVLLPMTPVLDPLVATAMAMVVVLLPMTPVLDALLATAMAMVVVLPPMTPVLDPLVATAMAMVVLVLMPLAACQLVQPSLMQCLLRPLRLQVLGMGRPRLLVQHPSASVQVGQISPRMCPPLTMAAAAATQAVGCTLALRMLCQNTSLWQWWQLLPRGSCRWTRGTTPHAACSTSAV